MPPFDSSLAIRLDPYRFIMKTCRDLGRDWFETRVMLEPAVCLSGRDAAEFFYDETSFQRAGAMPGFLKATLFGEKGVQGLDGAAHRHRKALSLGLLGPDRAQGPAQAGVEEVRTALAAQSDMPLADRLEEALTRAACRWAAMPAEGVDLPRLARQISRRFEHAGSLDLRQIGARRARYQTEAWAMDAVEAARSGAVTPPEGSALAVVAGWREPDGKALPPRVAAVELLNLIRPYVAIAAFLTFAAQRLAISPEWRARLGAEPGMARPFVTEVRRTAPFFPMIVARARRRTAWRDCRIPKGRLVMLDIYGTNRDPQVWEGPGGFRPERFAGKEPGPFDMIPQGGGDHAEGHRCSGEWVTEELMIAALPVLLDGIDWDNLPRQDLELDMRRLPALPKDRFRLA